MKSTSFEQFERRKKAAAKGKGHRGPAKTFELRRADNGFVSTTTHDVPPNAKGPERYDYDARRSDNVHPTIEHAAAHMVKTFGGKPKGEESAAHEAAETPATEAAEEA